MRSTLSQKLERLRHNQDSNTGIRTWKIHKVIIINSNTFGGDGIPYTLEYKPIVKYCS